MGDGGQHHDPTALHPRKSPVLVAQEAGWASEQVWTDAENLFLHRDSIRGPSRPYRVAIPTELSRRTTQSLYHHYRHYDRHHIATLIQSSGDTATFNCACHLRELLSYLAVDISRKLSFRGRHMLSPALGNTENM